MTIKYDKEIDALYIGLKRAKAAKTVEKNDGVLVDFDKAGKPIGIEILNYSKTAPKKERLSVTSGHSRLAIPAA